MLKPIALILIFAVPSGWLLGRAWSRPDDGVSVKPVAVVPAAPSARPAVTEPARKRLLSQDEFLDSIRSYSANLNKPGFSPMAEALADWTDEEIIAALEESIRDPAAHGLPGEKGNATLFLLQEWMIRDLDAAAKWAADLDSTLLKGQLAPSIASYWPPERGQEALAFLVANEGIFRDGHAAELLTKAVNSAVADGPAAVGELMRVARENQLDYFNVLPEFPKGFDFHALAAGGELKVAVEKDFTNPVILAWAKQDRDAAYRWTLENAGAGHVYEQLLGLKDGSPVADIKWAAGRYEEMDDEQRQEFMGSAGNFLGGNLVMIPYFSGAMEDPVLQEEFRLQGVQGIFMNRTGAMQTAETMLGLLGPPERRLEILEEIERQPVPGGGRPAPVQEERLRAIMGEWTTDQARIDRIINHLKQ